MIVYDRRDYLESCSVFGVDCSTHTQRNDGRRDPHHVSRDPHARQHTAHTSIYSRSFDRSITSSLVAPLARGTLHPHSLSRQSRRGSTSARNALSSRRTSYHATHGGRSRHTSERRAAATISAPPRGFACPWPHIHRAHLWPRPHDEDHPLAHITHTKCRPPRAVRMRRGGLTPPARLPPDRPSLTARRPRPVVRLRRHSDGTPHPRG